MKNWLMGAVIGVLTTTFAFDVEAQRRFGGGRNLGRPSTTIQKQQTQPPAQQQQAPQQQANPQAAPQQQAAQPGAAAGAAARPASPWRGALMGLAAGLGIAALASWLGFSETLAAILTAVLIALAVMLVIGFILRRLRGPQPAYQGASPSGYTPPRREPTSPMSERAALPAGVARPGSAMDEFARGAPVAQQWGVPANFDTAGFLGHAKRHFTRLQQAWDRGDLAELEEFTTPQMFTELTHELHGRQEATRTDGVDVDAALLGIESTPADYLASVRFSGTVRVNGDTERVDEVWNFTKPLDGKTGWLLAGIQQLS